MEQPGTWHASHFTATAPGKEECQDEAYSEVLADGALLVVADGLGSAPASARGARAAVAIATRVLRRHQEGIWGDERQLSDYVEKAAEQIASCWED